MCTYFDTVFASTGATRILLRSPSIIRTVTLSELLAIRSKNRNNNIDVFLLDNACKNWPALSVFETNEFHHPLFRVVRRQRRGGICGDWPRADRTNSMPTRYANQEALKDPFCIALDTLGEVIRER